MFTPYLHVSLCPAGVFRGLVSDECVLSARTLSHRLPLRRMRRNARAHARGAKESHVGRREGSSQRGTSGLSSRPSRRAGDGTVQSTRDGYCHTAREHHGVTPLLRLRALIEVFAQQETRVSIEPPTNGNTVWPRESRRTTIGLYVFGLWREMKPAPITTTPQ